MRIDTFGWLASDGDSDPPLVTRPTARTSPLLLGPLGVVWHWTGPIGDPLRLVERVQGYRRGLDRAASWHVLIARDGTVYQSAPSTRATWHVGRPGEIGGHRLGNVNGATFGVELENAGRLHKVGPMFLAGVHRVPAERAVRTSLGWFDRFTPEQEHAATRVLAALIERFGWKRKVCGYGHAGFNRAKEDPGPLWFAALPTIVDAAFARQEG